MQGFRLPDCGAAPKTRRVPAATAAAAAAAVTAVTAGVMLQRDPRVVQVGLRRCKCQAKTVVVRGGAAVAVVTVTALVTVTSRCRRRRALESSLSRQHSRLFLVGVEPGEP